jgi:mRNA interferase MazF
MGAEIKKIRPCVIVSRDALAKLPLKIVVPLTECKEAFDSAAWHISIEQSPDNGLSKKSSADTFQVRSISEMRLVRRLGELSGSTMERISEGLALSLAID